ncbi:hypothetical protein I4U23_003993 [Adineta vaga]|nr:hypothetical protein I4U23_003993 [Adineta vaga]
MFVRSHKCQKHDTTVLALTAVPLNVIIRTIRIESAKTECNHGRNVAGLLIYNDGTTPDRNSPIEYDTDIDMSVRAKIRISTTKVPTPAAKWGSYRINNNGSGIAMYLVLATNLAHIHLINMLPLRA